MAYVRLLGGVAAVAGFAILAAQGTAGSAQTKVGSDKAKVESAADRPVLSRQQRPLAIATRKSITQLTAAELESLRNGFAQMKAWNSEPHGSANFKRSLLYWANIHAYIGTGCGPTSALNNQGMSGISAQSKSTPDEIATWCTCQHSPQNGNNLNFLTWHRMYLYYFEKVLQAAAGDPKLRLPYWDYETDGHMPQAYRDQTYVKNGQTVDNPLFIPNRKSQLNAGTGTLTAAVVSTSGAMPATSYAPFNQALEQTPHGAVHCATGVNNCPTGYMGYVPTAGNDPIFYSHHANIDRLYECWLKVNPAQRLPTGATLDATFNFIDGAGNLVNRKAGDMLTTQQLGYGYTKGGGCPLVIGPIQPPILWREVPWKVFPLAGPTRLGRGTTLVPVRLPAELRTQFFSAAPRGRPPARQATLVIDDFTADEDVGAMYEVILEGANGKRVSVGVINAFNATAPQHEDMNVNVVRAAGRRFEATAALRALGAGAAEARLVLRPTSGVTGADPAPGTVNVRATARFSAARLELR